MSRPVLGITMGDPAGVGPEIAAKALGDRQSARQRPPPRHRGRARHGSGRPGSPALDLQVRALAQVSEATFAPDRIEVLDLANADRWHSPSGA